MQWVCSFFGLMWAQSFTVLAFVEGGGEKVPVELTLRLPTGQVQVWQGQLIGGKAVFELSPPGIAGEITLAAVGHLPVRLAQPIRLTPGVVLDFTDPKALHPKSGYVEKHGKACLAAGELGSLPDEPHPVINAYDYELFLKAMQSGDLRADFNGDGQVDARDADLLRKNQDKLLSTEL